MPGWADVLQMKSIGKHILPHLPHNCPTSMTWETNPMSHLHIDVITGTYGWWWNAEEVREWLGLWFHYRRYRHWSADVRMEPFGHDEYAIDGICISWLLHLDGTVSDGTAGYRGVFEYKGAEFLRCGIAERIGAGLKEPWFVTYELCVHGDVTACQGEVEYMQSACRIEWIAAGCHGVERHIGGYGILARQWVERIILPTRGKQQQCAEYSCDWKYFS